MASCGSSLISPPCRFTPQRAISSLFLSRIFPQETHLTSIFHCLNSNKKRLSKDRGQKPMICFLPLKIWQRPADKVRQNCSTNKRQSLSKALICYCHRFQVYEFSLSILLSTEIEDAARSLRKLFF